MIFRDLSLRKKLTLLLMTAATTAVLLSSAVFYAMTVDYFLRAYKDDLTSLARVVGNNCSAALAFRLPEDAGQVLSSLSERPSVIQAIVRDSHGAIFAARGHGSDTLGDRGGQPGSPGPGQIRIAQEITLKGEVLGSITLVDDMRSMQQARLLAGFVFAGAVSVAMLLSWAQALYLQGFISKPILDLSAAAERISNGKGTDFRAAKTGDDEIGRLVETFNTMLDQIDRRSTELKTSERRFRALVDQAVDAFFLFDLQGRILDVNEMALEALGYRRDELLALNIRDITAQPPGDAAAALPWPQSLLQEPLTIETWQRRKDGTAFPVEMRLGNLDLGDQSFIMGLARDTSERSEAEKVRRRLEAQLQQSQKMEAIGVLAGGIAHDFNNILSAIIGYSELAKMKLPAGSPVSRDLDEVLRGGNRAADLVKQILTFSRQSDQERSPILITPIVKEAVKLLRASIPSDIEIRQEIDPRCGSVLAEPTQIHQIVMNLGTNAYHAMRDGGGVLDISAQEIEIAGEDASPPLTLSPGRYVNLTVTDTGHGMDRATLERIFEPYFTTKRKGEGTGMGLSVVHGIVTRMQGRISVCSEPGHGTTFQVYLPRIDERPDRPLTTAKSVVGGSERVLLVDDEEQIVAVVQELLSRLGYAVTAFLSPEEALAAFYRSPESFDLVITDMTMPGLTGTDLAREMLILRPDLPVMLCTGFSDRVSEEVTRSMGIRGFVMKPVVFTKLAASVRAALESREMPGAMEPVQT